MVTRDGGWADLVGDILDDLTAVAVSHLRLARQEAGDQGRSALRALAQVLAGALLLQAAVLFVAAAVGMLVGRWWDEPLVGLLVAGVVLLSCGLGLLAAGRKRLRSLRLMNETLEELGESRRWLQEDLFPRLRRNARD